MSISKCFKKPNQFNGLIPTNGLKQWRVAATMPSLGGCSIMRENNREGKAVKIVLGVLLASVLAATATHAQAERKIIEQWECYDRSQYQIWKSGLTGKPPVLVSLKRLKIQGTESGEIEVSSTTQAAKFRIEGFDRQWNFGPTLQHSFFIKPNQSGTYKSKGTASSIQFFNCEQR